MKPAPFEFAAPASLDEAASILREARAAGRVALLLAGGQSLLPRLRERLARADIVVWTGLIEELTRLEADHSMWRIGAGVTAATLEAAGARSAVLSQIGAAAGPPGIRSRATIGGGFASASATSDWLVRMAACSARLVIAGPGGTGTYAIEVPPAALPEDSIITEFVIPSSLDEEMLLCESVGAGRNAARDMNVALLIRRDGRRARLAAGTSGGAFAVFDFDAALIEEFSSRIPAAREIKAFESFGEADARLAAVLVADVMRAARGGGAQ